MEVIGFAQKPMIELLSKGNRQSTRSGRASIYQIFYGTMRINTMARRFAFVLAILVIAAPVFCIVDNFSPTIQSTTVEDREVENLFAFARIYGYVRFFHPSDEAASVDWDKVGILGAQKVRDAVDRDSLCERLLSVFRPIAPSIQLTDTGAFPSKSPASTETSDRLTFWQYFGVNLTGDSKNVYHHRRVIAEKDRALLYDSTMEGYGTSYRKSETPLNQQIQQPALLLRKEIAPRIVLQLPLAIPVDGNGKTRETEPSPFTMLQAQMATINPNVIPATDWRLRVAGVITVWNVFQHFHPYLDGIGAKWEEDLKAALRRALRDHSADDYYATLSELVAKSHDGHGYVYGRPDGVGGIPIRVAVTENQLVVTGVGEAAPFRKGDIIVQIDGFSALDVARERERYASGSPHLRQFRALNQFGEGLVGTVARISIIRDGAEQNVEFTRTPDRRGYFFNPIGEFVFPSFAEVRPGIFYVNLQSANLSEYEQKLPSLAVARGVIFDWRSDGRNSSITQDQRIMPHDHIIPHLIDNTVQASPMLVPQITLPDRTGWIYYESTWPVAAKQPRFKGQIVFIDDPSVVSYGETCMAIIADYQLAKLVGSPTAGTNGNVNYIPLPGGFRVMWTGMDVRKHDHSPFYTIGFLPEFPVTRTIQAVKEGRDEYLQKAIEVIEQSVKPFDAQPVKTGL
jgi:hypothetical protein